MTPGPASDIVLLIKGYKSSQYLNFIWPVHIFFLPLRAFENKQVYWQLVTFVKSTSPFAFGFGILNAQAFVFLVQSTMRALPWAEYRGESGICKEADLEMNRADALNI